MRLGPIAGATLIVPDLQQALVAYVEQLRLHQQTQERVPRQRALDLGDSALIDAPSATLALANDAPVSLTLIEVPGALPVPRAGMRGWWQLILAVKDPETVRQSLATSHWKRQDSADAGSCGFSGPAGEWIVLRRTPVPVSDRGMTEHTPALIGTSLRVANLATSIGFYQGLGLVSGSHQASEPLQAGASEPGQGLGVLRGDQRIEFIRAVSAGPREEGLHLGLRMISLARTDFSGRRLQAADDPSARVLAGPDREAIELV
jgi:catechol 2,3-dioxygenase-like lactoylglutathione lyase family enzyme